MLWGSICSPASNTVERTIGVICAPSKRSGSRLPCTTFVSRCRRSFGMGSSFDGASRGRYCEHGEGVAALVFVRGFDVTDPAGPGEVFAHELAQRPGTMA